MPSEISPSRPSSQRALGLALAHLGAAQELYGTGDVDLTHGVEQNQGERDADQRGGVAHGTGRYGKCERDGLSYQAREHQVHQLIQKHARGQTNREADRQHQRRFPENEAGQVPLFHAQNVIQAELLFAPAHKKAVGIEQKHHAEYGCHHNAQLQGKGQGARIVGTDLLQGADDVHHGRGEHSGENIGIVNAAVFADAAEGQPWEESFTHGGRLPWR